MDPTFSSPVILTEASDVAFMEIVTAPGTLRFSLPSSAALSYIDDGFAEAGTYYYRLVFKSQSPFVNSGFFVINDRTLNVLQMKK